MIDLTRISGTFESPEDNVNIVGCGAIGSYLALQLVKLGVTNFTLFDFDKVESHNISNQAYRHNQIGKLKTEALEELILEINPRAKVTLFDEKEEMLRKEEMLKGFVFLATDSPSSRKHILKTNKANPQIKGWFDCRTELFAVQLFMAKHNSEGVNRLINTLDFTDEEAEANIARAGSGCNSKQSCGVTSTLGALAIAKLFIDFVKEGKVKTFSRIDMDNFFIESYEGE